MKTLKEIEEEIRALAYELYEKRGRFPGRDLEDWFKAEKIVMSKYLEMVKPAGDAEAGGAVSQMPMPRPRKRTGGGGKSRKKTG